MTRFHLAWTLMLLAALSNAQTPKVISMAELLRDSPAGDWRTLAHEDTVYFELPAGRVVMELASAYAPRNAAAVRALVREGYFDGSRVLRVQDNYVTQWGRPDDDERAKEMSAKRLPPEFFRNTAPGLPFTRLAYADTYAAEVGYSGGFPAARDARHRQTWLVHCYGMVGVGRDNAPDSGNGSELYAVIGHAPRHLDRNITLVGRVVQGIELLSALPRGSGPLGFYEQPAQRTAIRSARVAADVPAAERVELEALRSDSATFAALVKSRAFRREEWFREPAGRVGVCNVPLPVRTKGTAAG
jgi:peptidylprolyl isomerase